MQEDEEAGEEDDEDNNEENCINANNQQSLTNTLNALGMMPVMAEIFPTAKPDQPAPAVTPKTQVPRLKTVPLRKISLKQPEQPIPIAPVNKQVPMMPKLIQKPTLQHASSTPINSHQKLPKLKLSIKNKNMPINNSSRIHFEYERTTHSQDDGPPTKAQKTHEDSTAAGGNSFSKAKSIEMVKDMQRDLITEFFKKQQELITEEYEFQRRQDEMLLKSFEDQNRVLLTAAKSLIEQIPSNFYL